MQTTVLRFAFITGLAAAGFALAASSPAPAAAAPTQTQTVRLKDINEQLVPSRLVRGDREFGGNGPNVHCEVTLSVTADQRRILAAIDFKAKETKADWSETQGSWSREVYRAPAGRTIDGIVDGASSTVQFISKPAGFQLLAPSQDFAAVLRGLQRVSEALFTFAVPGAPAPHTAAQKEMKKLSDQVVRGTSYLLGLRRCT